MVQLTTPPGRRSERSQTQAKFLDLNPQCIRTVEVDDPQLDLIDADLERAAVKDSRVDQ